MPTLRVQSPDTNPRLPSRTHCFHKIATRDSNTIRRENTGTGSGQSGGPLPPLGRAIYGSMHLSLVTFYYALYARAITHRFLFDPHHREHADERAHGVKDEDGMDRNVVSVRSGYLLRMWEVCDR